MDLDETNQTYLTDIYLVQLDWFYGNCWTLAEVYALLSSYIVCCTLRSKSAFALHSYSLFSVSDNSS